MVKDDNKRKRSSKDRENTPLASVSNVKKPRLSKKKVSEKANSKPNAQEKKKAKPKKKNISLIKPIQKVVDAIVQPIKTLAKKPVKNDIDVPFAESTSTELTTSLKFFYSNDRFLNTFDDKSIYDHICNEYPALSETHKNVQHKRIAILNLLNNDEYIQNMIDNYGMSIFDIITFLFRLCPSLFKGIFIKKIQRILNSKKYVRSIKKHKYKIAKAKSVYKKRRRRK